MQPGERILGYLHVIHYKKNDKLIVNHGMIQIQKSFYRYLYVLKENAIIEELIILI